MTRSTPELLERAVETEVLSIRMPVLSATDLVAGKLLALSEHACDFGTVLPAARALREQVDWAALRTQVAGTPTPRRSWCSCSGWASRPAEPACGWTAALSTAGPAPLGRRPPVEHRRPRRATARHRARPSCRALPEVPHARSVRVRTAPVRRRRPPADHAGRREDAGMTTAEYAVGTVAACGFGGILYKVITSGAVLDLLTGVISTAFKLSFF